MNLRQAFLLHLAPTSTAPMALQIERAEGCTMWDGEGRPYLDLIGGISVANVGHRHPAVVRAIKDQADRYLHVMVYGELVQGPQVRYASALAALLPPGLESVYFTNSGAEATEGAMKLAKRATGRTEMISFVGGYHGSTQGALSIIGDEYWRRAYRPLLPDIQRLRYNSEEDLSRITARTAAVAVEAVQAESGVTPARVAWLQALRKRCTETGALMVLDEIQTGFGRTGTLWAMEGYGIVPDILLLGKALGGGLPLGAFISSRSLMAELSDNPVLGHITTFGGHPLSCAAGAAALEAMQGEGMLEGLAEKEALWRSELQHPGIRTVRSCGLWLGVEWDSFEECKRVIDHCLANGVFTDWFLFAPQCLRIAPPLTITEEEIRFACSVINSA